MRVMDKVDAVSKKLRHEVASSAIWEAREDLPATSWGGGGVLVYWPEDVKAAVDEMEMKHDEL